MGTFSKTITRFNHLDHEGINGRKVRRLPPLFLLASVLLAGCALVDEDTSGCPSAETGSTAITFSADSQPLTRTAQGTLDETAFHAAGFGVFAANTGTHEYISSSVTPDFMYNQKVTYYDAMAVWEYEPVKYWPVGEDGHDSYLTFYGYAPYSKADGSDKVSKCIVDFSRNDEKGDPWLVYQLGGTRDDWQSSQVDLLYAFTKDHQKVQGKSTVGMTFCHALAGIGDVVKVKCSGELQDKLKALAQATSSTVTMTITSIVLNYALTPKARLVLNGITAPNWQLIDSGDVLTHRVVSLTPDYVLASSTASKTTVTEYVSSAQGSSNLGIMVIPVEHDSQPQVVDATINYRLSTGYEGLVGGTARLSDHYGEGRTNDLTFTLSGETEVSGSSEVSVGMRILPVPDMTYTGSALTPAVVVVSNDGQQRVLIKDVDYTLAYTNNTDAALSTAATAPTVTATGIGDYTGKSARQTFTIHKAVGTISFDGMNHLVKVGDGTVTYSSSNTSVATVDGTTGEVSHVELTKGTVVITATVADGTNYTYPVKTASYTLVYN